ncbi:MAG: rhomboid family intramembrane serine protease [Dinghuibacter sp.]|nr:rhomboid family intramembrane serine protease [Dinghuibacter sp.]
MTPVVKNLIIINALVWLALRVFNSFPLLLRLSLFPIDRTASYNETIFRFNPYQLITHMFTHWDFTHLLFNMIGLYIFGTILERVWGPKRFLTCYLLAGLGAAALHLLVLYLRGPEYFSFAMGASGAVMGLLAAFAYLFPNTPMLIFPIPVPIKAIYMALGYMAIDLFGGLGNFKGDRIAHFAHLGGAITGFILVLYWNKTNKRTLY